MAMALEAESESGSQPGIGNQPDYTALKRRIQEAGLLDKRPAYYVLSITCNTVVMIFCLVALFTVGAVWAQALAAVGLAIVSGQLGFQLHDSGHRQMFVSASKNAFVGLVTADLLLGMSYGWWVQKHNRHHGNPNDVDLDPDIKVGAIAYTDEQARARRGAGRLAAMYQAYLFFPLTTFLAWSMHVTGLSYLIKERSRYRRLELGLLAVHAIVYLTAMVYFLGPWSALMVVLIHKAVGGAYLASVFAPNHKGMPQTDSATRMDFVRTQVLTARNVRSHPVTDLWYGSLNYQIEHHLFPGMPRLNMRRAQPIIKQFCREHGIEYYETSFLDSYRELLGFLNEIGAPLRAEGIRV
ncbi:MAG: acyl-CoA desaturase [Chloroflexi bacterium]|nr:MAG: acyl-CoA desaturase [Chloroflexota bacterium]